MDRVQVLKRETAAGGGDGADEQPWPEPIEPQEDAIEAAGVYVQDASNRDESVGVFRDGDDLILKDVNNPSGLDLSTLAAGSGGVTEDSHKALRQLIHFIGDGPGAGFGSGPYVSEMLPADNPFPTSETWFTDSGKTDRIARWEATYNADKTYATETWIVYKADGTNPAAQAVDTYTYGSTPFTPSRSRAVTVYP